MLEKLPNKLLLNSDFLLKNEFSSGISGEPECLDETIHFICCKSLPFFLFSNFRKRQIALYSPCWSVGWLVGWRHH